jgi:hypothetical protein
MGLQSHQFKTRKSKWGTQFNYAGIQHQTLDQYTGVSDLIAKLKMELTLQSKSLFCLYNEL